MGLSSSTTKTTSNATTKPIVPDYAQGPINNYYSGVGNLMANSSPQDFVVAPTRQQQAAFGANFTGQNNAIDSAIDKAQNTPRAGYALAQTAQGTAQQAQAPDRGILGGLTLGDPTKVDLSGLQGIQAQQAQQGQQAVAGTAGGSMASQFVDQYQPYANKALVDNTMASFRDQSGREKAAYAAEAAGRGAFGGSRQAIGEAQLGADISLRGGLLRSQMEDAALTRALGAAAGDADRTTQAGIATAGNQTQASVANANNSNSMNMFNAGQQNDILKLLTQGQIQGELANAGYANQFDLARYGTENDNNQLIYGTEADLGMFNTGQANSMSQFNTGQQNSNNQFNAQTRTDNSQFNANFGLNQANTLGNLGQVQGQYARDDATTNANIGGQEWSINQMNQLAPYTQMAAQGELLNPQLLSILTGQQADGTSTSKEKMNLLAALIAGGSKVGSAIAGGG